MGTAIVGGVGGGSENLLGFNSADTTAGDVSYTLPLVGESAGSVFTFIKNDASANKITITAASGETINGAASYDVTAQYEAVNLYAPLSGTMWLLALTTSSSDVTLTNTVALTNKTYNKVTITAPATSATLTIPDGVVVTGPAVSGTIATLGGTQTLTATTLTGAKVQALGTTMTTNGAVTIQSGNIYMNKAGILALTVAAPSSQDGIRITFINIGSASNVHTVTFTGATLQDGITGGGKTTVTFTTGFLGQSFTVIAQGVVWWLESKNAVAIT